MIVVAIIGLLAAIAVPNFVKARETTQRQSIYNNLRMIDAAKQQWALENRLGPAADSSSSDAAIYAYLKGGAVPQSVVGETYNIGATVADEVTATSVPASVDNMDGSADGTMALSTLITGTSGGGGGG